MVDSGERGRTNDYRTEVRREGEDIEGKGEGEEKGRTKSIVCKEKEVCKTSKISSFCAGISVDRTGPTSHCSLNFFAD